MKKDEIIKALEIIATTKPVIVKNEKGEEFEAYYDESRELVFVKSYTREFLTSLGYTITIKREV